MSNLLNIIAIVLMILGSLISVVFIIYLRVKTYQNKVKYNSLDTLSFQMKIETGVEVMTEQPFISKSKTKTIYVKQKEGAYVFDMVYDQLLNGCVK